VGGHEGQHALLLPPLHRRLHDRTKTRQHHSRPDTIAARCGYLEELHYSREEEFQYGGVRVV
jgi:hypothetical protein